MTRTVRLKSTLPGAGLGDIFPNPGSAYLWNFARVNRDVLNACFSGMYILAKCVSSKYIVCCDLCSNLN